MSVKSKLDAPRIKWLIEPGFEPNAEGELQWVRSGLDWQGREYPDPTPMKPPEGLSVNTRDTLLDSVRAIVRDQLAQRAIAEEGFETFEESENFDVPDDNFPVDPRTPWEAVFDPPPAQGGEPGNGPVAAPGAVQVENRAVEHAAPPPGVLQEEFPIERRASEGLVSPLSSTERTVEKPTRGERAVPAGMSERPGRT